MSRYAWFSFALLSLSSLLGCSGPVEPADDTQEEPTAVTAELAPNVEMRSHRNRDDDDGDDVEWLCKASLIGGGPIFYEVDSDLGRAMDFALAECERQMHEPCAIRGCKLLRHHH